MFLFDWDLQVMRGQSSPMAVGNLSSGGDRSEQKVRQHIQAPALEHTMAENPPAHTGVHTAAAIKFIASVSSHMHG